jgi:hypothetical protein
LVDSTERQVGVAHLIHQHKLTEGGGFRIVGEGTRGRQQLIAELIARKVEPRFVVEEGEDEDEDEVDEDDEESEAGVGPGLRAPLSLRLDWSDASSRKGMRLAISRQGGLSLGRILSAQDAARAELQSPVWFITTEGPSRSDIISMFDRVVLAPDEETVLQALRTIEPAIERIASVGSYARPSPRDVRSGLAMMVAGQRLPIGSMGDGIWRLLGIALAFVRARGGVLLVDEIDTGLHYTMLVDMWRLVLATARSLDVQVFATTHSRDCYEALAAVTEPNRTEISLQRIERGKVEAIAFTEVELRQVAERGLEVR